VDEYISATVGKSCLNVGEFWVDMAWSGSDLEPDQNAARQKLCDWINANGHSAPAFDSPTKGILQVSRHLFTCDQPKVCYEAILTDAII